MVLLYRLSYYRLDVEHSPINLRSRDHRMRRGAADGCTRTRPICDQPLSTHPPVYKPPTSLVHVETAQVKTRLAPQTTYVRMQRTRTICCLSACRANLDIALRARVRLEGRRRAAPGPRGKPLPVNVKEWLKSSRFYESL